MQRFILYVFLIFCAAAVAQQQQQQQPPPPDGPDGPPPPGGGGSPPPPPDSRAPTPSPTPKPTIDNCVLPETTLDTYLSVDGPGNPDTISQDDLNALQIAFQETYDTLAQFNCDRNFRRIENVTIQIYDYPPPGTMKPVKITFLYHVEYSCKGKKCNEPGPPHLFNLDNGFLGRGDNESSKMDDDGGGGPPPPPPDRRSAFGDRDLKSDERQLQDEECDECQTNNPSNKSPSPRQFVDSYRAAVEALNLPTLNSIINILEVEPQDCPAEEQTFNETVLFELEGDPTNVTASDLQLLGTTFLSSYNYYAEVECDGRFLKVEQIELLNDPIFEDTSLRHLQDFTFSFNYTSFIFFIRGFLTGYCRGCPSTDVDLLTDDASRLRFRRQLEGTGLRGKVVTQREMIHRRMQQQFIANFSMGDYRQSMEDECKGCSPRASNSPSSSPTRIVPGARFFGADTCFCAKKELGMENKTVGLDDTFNATFQEESGDGRYRGLERYRGVSFGRNN